MFNLTEDQHNKDMTIAENCECGLTQDGEWDETLFDQWGCNCERPKPKTEDKPEPGKQYSLAAKARGKTWADAEIPTTK